MLFDKHRRFLVDGVVAPIRDFGVDCPHAFLLARTLRNTQRRFRLAIPLLRLEFSATAIRRERLQAKVVTTLEPAALQSLIEPEEYLELDGLSDQAWR